MLIYEVEIYLYFKIFSTKLLNFIAFIIIDYYPNFTIKKFIKGINYSVDISLS